MLREEERTLALGWALIRRDGGFGRPFPSCPFGVPAVVIHPVVGRRVVARVGLLMAARALAAA